MRHHLAGLILTALLASWLVDPYKAVVDNDPGRWTDSDDENAGNPSKSRAAQQRHDRKMLKFKTRYKARLVARGDEQQYEVDYWATFAPTPRMTTIRVLLALAAYFGWDVHQMDVETAFLNADLDIEIYTKILNKMNDCVKAFLQSKGN